MFPTEKTIPYLKKDTFFINHKILTYIFAVVFSLILDVAIFYAEETFQIALFLEFFGTALITFCFGLIPGLISASLCQLIIALLTYKTLYYSLYCFDGIFLATIIWFSFRKDKMYPQFLHLLFVYVILVICESFIGGGINNIIDILNLSEIDWESYSWFIAILIAQGMPVHGANILGRVPVNLISQIINVIGAYCAARGLEYLSAKINKLS